ncbi:U3 small nucleolar RNA-associated protein 6 homolog [Eurytemora carolleeae]|uniref:U3 small nucleolar RNA-associated protein 6 homolog n=1 Tax=Eurytemora carolleeae TaxID=1294199 RepID=UPI000C75F59E|nr:U3 small nucleolar RNA-associated protein 6 homolog [Eurytemora carolleeae]|eukprot:XP_023329988.1 U3 small nucleolar RNA-associated protein 6 homolog [Eurytemora affinis]
MAEYVEQRMEEMIPEVEELERVGLLSGPEVRELIKKRKHFEYKIQKRTKKKEDFFGYIEYETNLMNLIQLRRDEIGYHHKKGHIENGIKTRINKLYKILCHRWQSDTKIWLSYIDWLNKMKWKSSVSKTNLRLLQVHNNNPKLWIAAAKYEFENGAAENGRQILLQDFRVYTSCKHLQLFFLPEIKVYDPVNK